MKKIIVILLLVLGIKVNAQIVGGFMPPNSSKSFTAGAAQFTTLRASLGGTITGQATLSNTVNLIGNTRLISSATNTLTTGNTGTVAVLSDVLVPFHFGWTALSLADNTTYFASNLPYAPQTSRFGSLYAPYNMTLIGWSFSCAQNATVSAESCTLQMVANTTTTSLNSALTITGTINTYTNTGISVNVSTGDRIDALFNCPNFATNPISMSAGITFWFIRRQ